MISEVLLAALCLVLIVEGILPFLSPERWRQAMAKLASLNDRQLRTIGAVSMLSGMLLLQLIR